MAVEKDFELLDDYVANRLSGEEKTSFEKKMEADPELQNEYSLQQKLVEGIRNARALELKAMLNNTPIPPVQPGHTMLLAKIVAGVIVSGAVATGIYYFVNRDATKAVTKNEMTETLPVADEPVAETPVQQQSTEPAAKNDAVEKQEAKKTTEKKKEAGSSSANKSAEQVAKEVEKQTPYDPSAEAEAETETTKTVPTVTKATSTITNSSIAVETVSDVRKYQFHYQVKGGKLFLYGSFEKGLYTILEIFNEKRTMFLFFKGNYYLLNEDNEKIKPLVPITDATLLNKLKEYRGK